MSNVNRGKQFEEQIREAFLRIPNCSIDRIPDQMNGFAGGSNICDFIVYSNPVELYIECKSCYGNTLSINSNNPKNKYGAISNTQWEGLLEKSKIDGVTAGIMVWFIDHDITVFIKIEALAELKAKGYKSVNARTFTSDFYMTDFFEIEGSKRRVLFDYNMSKFLDEVKHDVRY